MISNIVLMPVLCKSFFCLKKKFIQRWLLFIGKVNDMYVYTVSCLFSRNHLDTIVIPYPMYVHNWLESAHILKIGADYREQAGKIFIRKLFKYTRDYFNIYCKSYYWCSYGVFHFNKGNHRVIWILR